MDHSETDQSQSQELQLPTVSSLLTTTSPAQSPSKSSNPALRILGKGDLIRLAESRGPGSKKRDGSLGRIIRSISIPQEELVTIQSTDPLDTHPFRYDIDFVLGGKMCNVHRRELVYTTADAEGMTADGDTLRSRRTRRPSSAVLAGKEIPEQSERKKGGGKKAPTATPEAAAKKGATQNASKIAKRKVTGGKVSTAATAKKAKSDESLNVAESNFIPKDVYEKHYREFERMVTRLEKIDHFDFFWGIEEQEDNDEYNGLGKMASGLIPTTASDAMPENMSIDLVNQSLNLQDSALHGDHLLSPPTKPDPFSQPPRSWEDIRKRRAAGRYEVDRIKVIEDERRKRLYSYRMWKRKNKRMTESLKPKIPKGVHPRVLNPKGVAWDLFRKDVFAMCDAALAKEPDNRDGGSGTLCHAVKKIKDEMDKLYERTGRRHISELQEADARHEFSLALQSSDNQEAAFQGDWRRIPFPEREYDRLSSNLICAGLGSIDELSASYELRTTLPDGFVGISYKYNDTGQSEGWMKSVLDESSHEKGKRDTKDHASNETTTAKLLASDQGVVRAQVQATMQNLMIQVQDKVMTDEGILKRPELRVANWEVSLPKTSIVAPELVEQPVWGMDCYTRRNVMICLSVEFDSETALEYVEKWLLPAVNACPANLAYDMTNAAKILEALPLEESGKDGSGYWSHSLLGQALTAKIKQFGPPWLSSVSYQLRRAIRTLGYDFFRVHPKGHGSIVLSRKLKANTLVTYYKGEVYPSWRWGEKMDAIEMTQQRLGLRPNLPDFYNMALERPQADPRGYGLMIVDASRKSGHGSMLSHSCEPTCEVRMASVNGVLSLAMTTLRAIEQGEELTFDYNAVTESLTEYSSAVCLCGFRKCRGSFLHFASADCYQQVLNRNSPIAVRFANLVKGCMKKVMATEDETILSNHGFGSAAFGAVSFNRYKLLGGMPSTARLHSVDYVPVWLRTYVADILRYIEYERRALPVALLCDHLESFKFKPPETLGKAKAKTKPKAHGKSTPGLRHKPENVFFFYCRQQRDYFTKVLRDEGELKNLKGLEVEQAVKKVMGTAWKALGEDIKSFWKQQALEDWKKTLVATEKSGELRVKSIQCGQEEIPIKERQTKALKSEAPINGEKRKVNPRETLNSTKISFEAADAEGVSAMEQRIQQLTQALSRIGRLLDRHRQTAIGSTAPSLEAINQIHAPLSIMTDEKTVRWIWSESGGPVQSLMHYMKTEKCASPALRESLDSVFIKNKLLTDFGLGNASVDSHGLSHMEARRLLIQALYEMRDCILLAMIESEKDIKRCRRDNVRKRKAERETLDMQEIRSSVELILQDLVTKIACDQVESQPLISVASISVMHEESLLPPNKKLNQYQPEPNQDTESRSFTLPLMYRELARLMEEIRRRDGGKDRFTFDKEYIIANASPALATYIVEKSAIATFHKNVTRALIPAKSRDFFESLRDIIRKRFDLGLPVDDLMKDGTLDIYVRTKTSSKTVTISKTVHKEAEASTPDDIQSCVEGTDESSLHSIFSVEMMPWLEAFEDRWKLEAAADLLILYAHTTTFFELIPYTPLKSSPIEVYARELGNAVPKSKIEVAQANCDGFSEGVVLVTANQVPGVNSQEATLQSHDIGNDVMPGDQQTKRGMIEHLCEPDDVITKVTVGYDGDFVLSQLLQWYNGGIGQKPGLPDMLGCVILPAMSGVFNGTLTKKSNKANSKTIYATELRLLLVQWLEDPLRRGSALPDDLRQVFAVSNERFNARSNCVVMGSPVLDLLVMGDDNNVNLALQVLRDNNETDTIISSGNADSTTEHLQSTVDEGRPAQAVANWVQCENPTCLKWRKVPWHVDLDLLPEKFFCKDNMWNSSSNSCDTPEDTWDENDTHVRSDGIEKTNDTREVHSIPSKTPSQVNKKALAKVTTKRQNGRKQLTASQTTKTSVEERESSPELEPSPTSSAPTLCEEQSTITEKEVLCTNEEFCDVPRDLSKDTESSTLNRLPRKKPNLEQKLDSGLLSSFSKPINAIPRKLLCVSPQEQNVEKEVPVKSLLSKPKSSIENTVDKHDQDVPRKPKPPQASVISNIESKKIESPVQQQPLVTSGKRNRWGPRLSNVDDESTPATSESFYYAFESEWYEDKPHPVLGSRFIRRKW